MIEVWLPVTILVLLAVMVRQTWTSNIPSKIITITEQMNIIKAVHRQIRRLEEQEADLNEYVIGLTESQAIALFRELSELSADTIHRRKGSLRMTRSSMISVIENSTLLGLEIKVAA